jgi:hypothetical protein
MDGEPAGINLRKCQRTAAARWKLAVFASLALLQVAFGAEGLEIGHFWCSAAFRRDFVIALSLQPGFGSIGGSPANRTNETVPFVNGPPEAWLHFPPDALIPHRTFGLPGVPVIIGTVYATTPLYVPAVFVDYFSDPAGVIGTPISPFDLRTVDGFAERQKVDQLL